MLDPADFAPSIARPASTASRRGVSDEHAGADAWVQQRIAETLDLLQGVLQPARRVVHAGDVIYRAGDRFSKLHILHVGIAKLVGLAADGREQVVAFKFRGDWLGFDGIAKGRYTCDAVAKDTGEVWSVGYQALLAACTASTALLRVVHEAMSREISHDRDSLMLVCSLPAYARVAEFLRYWAESTARRGLRNDRIVLRISRAEIGNYLGITLETVSRALSSLVRGDLIEFAEGDHRDIRILDVAALADFAQGCREAVPAVLQ